MARTKHSRAAAAGLLALILCGPARSVPQEVIEIVGEDFVLFQAMGEAVPVAAPTAAGQDQQPPSELLKAIQALKFDRRPSVILEAWAAPEPEPLPDEPPESEVASAPEGTEPAEDAEPPEGDAPRDGAGSEVEAAPDEEVSSDEGTTSDEAAASDAGVAPEGEAGPDAPASGDGAEPADGEAAPEDPAVAAAAAAEAARQQALAEHAKKVLERDVEIFQRDVTLGRWDRVAALLARLEGDEPVTAYEHLIGALPTAPQTPQFNRIPQQYHEKNSFSLDDVLALARMAPGDEGLTAEQAAKLAPIVALALGEGHVVEELIAGLAGEVAKPDAERVLRSRQAAWILSAIGEDDELGTFLPSADEAEADGDREALNLLARHHVALYADDPRVEHLEAAWRVTQAALATGEVGEEEKKEALRRAVELAPKVRDELGDRWLAESFSERPDRGREVLATIGSLSALGFLEHAQDKGFRQTGLTLQKTAVDALLAAAPERASEWRASLNLLAANWLAEAQYSYENSEATSLGPRMQRDAYGNIFYYSFGGRRNLPVVPLEPSELLDQRPDGAWLELLDASVRPRFAMVVAQLYLKVNEEDRAFPFIEMLAATHPVNATELAEEFLRVWTRNHDPNSANRYTNSYMWIYGFEQRAAGIPLTRSKQERNLTELAKWVERLRALPVFGEIDDQLFVQAFTQCHSSAEVYRLEKLEAVFGDLDEQDPDTIAGLVQKMRTNLGDVWRRPSVQEDAKTKRRQKDIEREVLAGYELARATLSRALERHPDHWRLVLAEAALTHDENNYRQEVEKTTGFAGARLAALDGFERAAELYLEDAEDIAVDDETTEAFELWFYAGLGAVDLKHLDERTVPDRSQPAKILAALESLDGESRERHLSKFASALFTRLSAVNPACKFRYLEGGFEIVGDHPQAHEARKVLDYYRDLVTEIRLAVAVDGSDVVGQEPFGLRVDIRHTKEIERESGGFSKYLQNQNTGTTFYYNYGRPLENYRDKFQEAATTALSEHFDVLSVTFNTEDVSSKADAEYGWRVTPYAYVLLKARGPQVDTVPPLRLDLDFLDTSGYAVLPVASAALPVDCGAETPEARPFAELGLTQILDERHADEGRLVLEVKAGAKGLVPDLDSILELEPEEFVVTGVEDHGVSVTQFDEEQRGVVSERLWTISLAAREGSRDHPETFQFGTARLDVEENVLQRYADADLVTAEPSVRLGELYGDPGFPWLRALGPAALVLVAAALWFQRRRAPRGPVDGPARALPDPLTPFAVLGLLREVQASDGLPAGARAELAETIAGLERHYFSPEPGEAPDLRALAERWVRAAG